MSILPCLLLHLYKWQRLYMCVRSPSQSALSIAREREKFSSFTVNMEIACSMHNKVKINRKTLYLATCQMSSFFFLFSKFERTGFQCTLHWLACDIWEQMDLQSPKQAADTRKTSLDRSEAHNLAYKKVHFYYFPFHMSKLSWAIFHPARGEWTIG